MNPRAIQPNKLALAQKLDNARAMLVVNGVLTSAQSREVRRKILEMLGGRKTNNE